MSSRKAIHGPEVQPRPMGQEESELSSERGLEGTLTDTSQYDQQGRLSPPPNSGEMFCLSMIQKKRSNPIIRGLILIHVSILR